MSNFDSEVPENEWDERGDLAWNEFDWERYLREQDEAIVRYLELYQAFKRSADRIDAVARKMGWEPIEAEEPAEDADEAAVEEDGPEFAETGEVYTLHKNPVFIATKAIYLSLKRDWEALAAEPGRVPPAQAVPFLASLHRGEEIAVQAIHALDFGDYAMAVSLFKRALSALNQSLAILGHDELQRHKAAAQFREEALPRLFDLREIWLRVIAECRGELDRPGEDES